MGSSVDFGQRAHSFSRLIKKAVVNAYNEPPRVCMLPGRFDAFDLLSTSGVEKDVDTR